MMCPHCPPDPTTSTPPPTTPLLSHHRHCYTSPCLSVYLLHPRLSSTPSFSLASCSLPFVLLSRCSVLVPQSVPAAPSPSTRRRRSVQPVVASTSSASPARTATPASTPPHSVTPRTRSTAPPATQRTSARRSQPTPSPAPQPLPSYPSHPSPPLMLTPGLRHRRPVRPHGPQRSRQGLLRLLRCQGPERQVLRSMRQGHGRRLPHPLPVPFPPRPHLRPHHSPRRL